MKRRPPWPWEAFRQSIEWDDVDEERAMLDVAYTDLHRAVMAFVEAVPPTKEAEPADPAYANLIAVCFNGEPLDGFR